MATGREGHSIRGFPKGFLLWQEGTEEKPQDQGGFVALVDDPDVVVDHCWFRGGWFDPGTIAWRNIRENVLKQTPPVDGTAPGASLFLPFRLSPGQEKVVRLLVSRGGTDQRGRQGSRMALRLILSPCGQPQLPVSNLFLNRCHSRGPGVVASPQTRLRIEPLQSLFGALGAPLLKVLQAQFLE